MKLTRLKNYKSEYISYALHTALGADWLYEEGTWALPMIVMAALLWPAVKAARESGAENPAEQVFDSQHAVMDMSEEDAEYFLATLSLEGAEMRDRDEIRRETELIFEKQFRTAQASVKSGTTASLLLEEILMLIYEKNAGK